MKPRLLWVSDGVVHTGFARVSHAVLPYLQKDFDVAMLAAHYSGKPHRYPYDIWPGISYSEPYGYANFVEVFDSFRPDVVLVLNDSYYVAKWQKLREKLKAPCKLVGYMPMDGPNLHPEIAGVLSQLDMAIFYTRFGLEVAQQAGFKGIASIIPHGIDRSVYYPIARDEARHLSGLSAMKDWRETFIVGNVNRNQPRKRLDLTLAFFADWVEREKLPETVKLYLHCAQKDVHIADVADLAKYFGIQGRVILPGGSLRWDTGVAEEKLAAVYSSIDLGVSTTLGEGWGLTVMEAMACGVAQMVPEWAALAEWPRGAIEYVACSEIEVFHGLENRIGAVPDRFSFIDTLTRLYNSRERREELRRAGLELVARPEYRWENVAQAFANVIGVVLGETPREAAVA